MLAPALLSDAKSSEELLAELASATYRAARRRGFKGAFIDIELDVWEAQITKSNAAALSAAPIAAIVSSRAGQ
jgi:hypothetical protein